MRAQTITILCALCLVGWPLAAVESGRVTGCVVDLYGFPIEGAVVSIKGAPGGRSTSTDDEGRFEFHTLPQGSWRIEAQSPGFATEARKFLIREGEHQRIDFGLRVYKLTDMGPCRLRGSVRDEKGTPLRESMISVLNPFDERLRSTVPSDKTGRFVVDVENPGQYVVYARKPSYAVGATTIACEPTLPRPTIDVSLTLRHLDGP